MERLKTSADNRQARMYFVEYWAALIRQRSDQGWGREHTSFINAVMHSGKYYPLTAVEYLEMKGEPIGKSRLHHSRPMEKPVDLQS